MQTNADPFNLERFVATQQNMYATALAELRAGRKRTHWMWFIFPQIEGLGLSSTAKHYAIKSRDEAHAYLAHPVLGPRLAECTDAVLAVDGRSALDILGTPDDLKLRSCATLFAAISEPGSRYEQVLAKYYRSIADQKTLDLLAMRT